MKNDKNIFTDEYNSKSTELSGSDEEQEKLYDSDIKIDEKYYDVNKPDRKIIKGKIIHDKDKKRNKK